MKKLGKKSEIFGVENLQPINPPIYGKPTSMPKLEKDHHVIAGFILIIRSI